MTTEANDTEVGRWLRAHNMPEWIEVLSTEGYDDLEELRLLCTRDQPTFNSIVTKPGHRKKIQRLLGGEGAGGASPQVGGSSVSNTNYFGTSENSSSLQIPGQEGRRNSTTSGPIDISASLPNRPSAFSPPSRNSTRLSSAAPAPGTSFTSPGGIGPGTSVGGSSTVDVVAPTSLPSAGSRLSQRGTSSGAAGNPSDRAGSSHRATTPRRGAPSPSQPIAESPSAPRSGINLNALVDRPRDLPAAKDDILLKIIVVGESSCGKTSYIRQLVEGRFSPNIRSTVGLDFSEKRFIMKDTPITVQLWDISGQERFASMTRAYYKGAHGAMVCYDVTRPKSFEMVERWKQDIDSKVFLNEMEQVPIPAILMGNKCDCEKKVELSNVELAKYCAANKFVGWYETSAKTNYNVREASEYLVTHIMKQLPMAAAQPAPEEGVICLQEPAADASITPRDPKAGEAGAAHHGHGGHHHHTGASGSPGSQASPKGKGKKKESKCCA